ncbi:MAG TPA: D-glycero-beta-D-manno-heptose-7-phosphate kinase [Thermodesulfobacteriota bacterium]|nr:D-glycero-beta-D-manno-heptose-7-phosphate kinase [Thermodesulfobacteriota bacterium]
MNKQEMISLVSKFKNARLMVIGDLMVDEYIWGSVSRISPEAPVPVVSVTSESLRLGGAGNVVNNIHSLGGKVLIGGVVGNDEMGRKIVQDLHKMGIETKGIVVEPDWITTVKTRIIAHNQQVVRYDREIVRPIRPEALQKILSLLEDRINGLDAVLISDYGKGVICPDLVERVRSLALGAGKIISVDPKVKNFPLFQRVTIITPNHHEAGQAAGRWIQTEEDLMQVGRQLLDQLQSNAILITRGEKGMTLFQDTGEITNIPTMAQEVFDVTGAGDTVISVLTMALAVGANPKQAALLSNYAAGIVVGEVGTATLKASELEDAMRNGIRRKGHGNAPSS